MQLVYEEDSKPS